MPFFTKTERRTDGGEDVPGVKSIKYGSLMGDSEFTDGDSHGERKPTHGSECQD
jgi:hypothetical protein